MNDQNEKFVLEIQTTDKKCPIGETTGKENLHRSEWFNTLISDYTT